MGGERPEESLRVLLDEQRGVDERLDRDVVELEGEAQLTGEDQRLAGHVQSRQVVAGVWLGVPEVPGAADRDRERGAGHHLLAEEAERAGEASVIRSTTSPVATRFRRVSMTGRPAPTVVS